MCVSILPHGVGSNCVCVCIVCVNTPRAQVHSSYRWPLLSRYHSRIHCFETNIHTYTHIHIEMHMHAHTPHPTLTLMFTVTLTLTQ